MEQETKNTRINWALAFGTVAAGFADSAKHFPDHPVIDVLPETAEIYGIAAGSMSYAALSERVYYLYDAYYSAGYLHGDRVGLLLENRPVFLEHWLALNTLGVSVVPISAEMRVAELSYLIAHSEIVLAVALPSHHSLLHEAALREGLDLNVIAMGEAIPARPVRSSQAERDAASATRLPGLNTECALLYTSGTTGRPKGCVLSNEYFLFAGGWYLDLGGLCTINEGSERLITPLPLNHMNAMACSTMAMLLSGGCVVLVDRFHPKTWWKSVRESRATVLHYLGVMPSMLMLDDPCPEDRLHQVRFGFGAGVDKRLHQPFEERFGFPLIEGWAMTETGVAACIIAHQEPRFIGSSCFGKPSEHVEVRIVNDEESDVAQGEHGQLLVRRVGANPSLGFFDHYLKDPDATAEAWAGGWFHTGDVVQADELGYLHFIDRKKNVIRRSGENISAVEVETVLRRHPAVKDVAVAATPDQVRGDEVLACVVLKDEFKFDPQESLEPLQVLARALAQHCLNELAYFKAPGWVAFVPSLPLTLTQKVQRGELKALAMSLPGQANCFDTTSLKKREALAPREGLS
jgi:acyl-CoA synthetase (AMP-forming)/AMP-acid ligase II